MSKDDLDPENLKPTLGDVLHRSTKAGLGSVPFIGSALSEIFGFGVEAPLEKRKNKFIFALKEKVEKLEQNKMIDKDALINDDAFMDIVIQAYEIALKNSQDEKIKVLQNAVLNSALKIDLSQDEKSMFLNIINDLTPTDIIVLKLCYHPHEAIRKLVREGCRLNEEGKTNEHQVTILSDFAKYLRIDPNFFNIILNNLETRGLLQNTKGSHSSGLPLDRFEEIINGLISATNERTTGFGRRFLQFVSEPQIFSNPES